MKKGFTLIELLVVVLIIGILSAIALPTYLKSVEKARVSEALLVGKAIRDAKDRLVMSLPGKGLGKCRSGDYVDLCKNFSKLDISVALQGNGDSEGTTSDFIYNIEDPERVRIERKLYSADNKPVYVLYMYSSLLAKGPDDAINPANLIFCWASDEEGESTCKSRAVDPNRTKIGPPIDCEDCWIW